MPTPTSHKDKRLNKPVAVQLKTYAWKKTKDWAQADVDGYGVEVVNFLESTTKELDCADTAIEVLIHYAWRNGLPAAFWNTSMVPSPVHNHMTRVKAKGVGVLTFPTGERFRRRIQQFWGARSLAHGEHTVAIARADARAGDLLIIDRGASAMGHTLLVGKDAAALYYGNYPPASPVKVTDPDTIDEWFRDGTHGGSALVRRWNFDRFNQVVK
ncbi:MAG: hypothetical protein HY722_10530 [Planctomycetes bacterium]|nr:hypothetical protein [Planctomycetota bacterium]